jgi:hypothetical protein
MAVMLDFCVKGLWFETSWILVWISPFFPHLIPKIVMIKSKMQICDKWHPKLPKIRNVGVACH